MFFLLFVNLLFIFLYPNAYDGIRQFLFLLPYISLIFVESINELFSKKSVRLIFFLASLLYVVYSQYTLGPYKYVYLNEFSDEINISEYCEKIDGCGDWPTDYYAFSGRELAKKILSKEFNPNLIKNMNDEDAIEYLTNLRQIGRWSAEMILLFTFNRPNIWPLQDIGLLRAISNNYKKKYFPPKKFLKKLYKKFSPYCSVATWYLWRSIDNEPIQY